MNDENLFTNSNNFLKIEKKYIYSSVPARRCFYGVTKSHGIKTSEQQNHGTSRKTFHALKEHRIN